jgi:hypothetical protein
MAARPEAFEGRVIGAGYCVDFVKAAAGVPRTTACQEGAEVRGDPHTTRGTAIATLPGQPRHLGLQSMAGPARAQAPDSLRGGSGKWGSKSNDGRCFAVIE